MRENIDNNLGYHITEDGILYSNKSGTWKQRKGMVYRNYLQYMIQGKWYKAHRLVAMAYIPNPNNYPIVMHKDNNPLNNKVSNLKWGTHSMNNLQCSKEGRGIQYRLIGKLNPMYGRRGNLSPMYGRRGELHPSFGKPNAMKGKHISESHKFKISNSLRELHRTKLTERKKRRIMRLRSLNKSQTYIAKRVKLHQTAISKFLRGGLG